MGCVNWEVACFQGWVGLFWVDKVVNFVLVSYMYIGVSMWDIPQSMAI
jgi:hypothetical protein